jgi:glyoxylase-like metal-dependent hydrolase (beta-lactamase superfamily II)
MKRLFVLGALLVAGAVSLTLSRPQAQQPPPIAMEKVRDNLYMITGGGGNTAAFITAKGVVVVDTKNPKNGQAILDKIKTVTDKPVTMIINTHTHGDHVGSNTEFPPTVEVVAHENCKASMEKMDPFKTPEGQKYLPSKTYKDKLSLLQGKEKIDLYYFGRGHTSGDTIIVFTALRVAHTGDLFAAKGAPLIDTGNGGSAIEYPKTLAAAGAKIKGVETVIPGHSPVTDWKAFQEYGAFVRAFADAVEAGVKQGKTADEITAALKLPDEFKDYAMQRAKDDVAKFYADLKK